MAVVQRTEQEHRPSVTRAESSGMNVAEPALVSRKYWAKQTQLAL